MVNTQITILKEQIDSTLFNWTEDTFTHPLLSPSGLSTPLPFPGWTGVLCSIPDTVTRVPPFVATASFATLQQSNEK